MSKDDPHAEGVVGTWFVRDGQQVAAGQLIAEVQVDKVAQDVLAPAAGTIRLVVAEEAPARQGDVIATIEA
jgi:pyruvate/2-oxoglutarate dehydrogenase complex dihydrolipoamide acyltransferase (E2) component